MAVFVANSRKILRRFLTSERESKQKKRRKAAYKYKVPEMMIESDKLIDRVKSAGPELLKTGMESVYSTGMQAQNVFNLMCDQCGYRVSYNQPPHHSIDTHA